MRLTVTWDLLFGSAGGEMHQQESFECCVRFKIASGARCSLYIPLSFARAFQRHTLSELFTEQ